MLHRKPHALLVWRCKEGANMGTTSTRLRFSEEELEGFISELWLALEKHHLPSPDLRLRSAGAGATTIELRFPRRGDLRRALQSLTKPDAASAIL
jgi:hypothetical protein